MISTVADTEKNLDALSTALTEIDSLLTPAKPKSLQKPPCDGKMHKITLPKEFEATALGNCIGKICAEFIYAYPPDIPLITPNDEITADFLKLIREFKAAGTELVSDSGLLISNCILTKQS